MTVELLPAAQVHAELLAAMHRICFAEPWNQQSMAATLGMPGVAGLIAVEGASLTPSLGGAGPAGLLLWRLAAGEAEILTLAVLPPWRRRGLGRRLMEAACAAAASGGAEAMFLEVAADNTAAAALYRDLGFAAVGVRKGYYNGIDALTMRRDLGPSA
jgi:ribosomal-protein-alanine N-acetyltransferase